MRLVTFEDPVQRRRIGAVTDDARFVDLHSACSLYLRDVENESAFERLADALVPPDMLALFQGGDTSLEAAHKAFDHALRNDGARGPSGETIFYSAGEVKLKAPIIPRKFFHTAGNFREHHEEATKAGFSHPVMPWIVFFQNVDAIIGHDEPVIYPEHLTNELDYELELAVVLKKGGKHFSPEEAAARIGGYVIFNDITARDIQRREMKSGVFSFCKGIDTFCPLGPWIVTADEIPNPHKLAMELRVNGESRQRFAFQQNVSENSRDSLALFAHGLQRRRRGIHRHGLRRSGFQWRSESLVPETRRRNGMRNRKHRHTAKPRHLLGGSLRPKARSPGHTGKPALGEQGKQR